MVTISLGVVRNKKIRKIEKELNQFTIPSFHLGKSIPFYETIGLKLIVKSFPNYARFECPDGNSTFSIQQTNKLPKGEGIHIYFECEKMIM